MITRSHRVWAGWFATTQYKEFTVLLNLLLLVIGILMLAVGGEVLVRGALAAAFRLGISPLLSGLVIVGFGTSAPELVVSVDAAISERPDIAVGNVVGSNIANILLILGVCALITPLAATPLALRRDAVTVVAATLLFFVLAWGSALGRWDAAIFLAALAAYLIWAYWSERDQTVPSAELHKAEAEELKAIPRSTLWTVTAVIAGLLVLIAGSRVLLTGAVGIAADLGIPEVVVGLTLVAVGTSLPEFSISVIAALRRHADVAIGNILGSNIFNLLGILGVSALLQPLPLQGRIVHFDQWVMLVAAVVLLLFLLSGRGLGRIKGGILLAGYIAYIAVGVVFFGG